MRWYEVANNPRQVTERYHDPKPDLEGQIIQSVFLWQLRRVEMRVKLTQFPDVPSPKWDKRATAAVVNFTLHELESAHIAYPAAGPDVKLTITGADGGFILQSSDKTIRVVFRLMQIDGFEAYA